jgi:hypothetical protein
MPRIIGLQRMNECRDFVRSHFGKMTQKEMHIQLQISNTTLKRIITELKLAPPKARPTRTVIQHGKIFNVYAHQDWLAGSR